MVAMAFAQYAAHLLEGGYSPVPLIAGQKRPLFENWQRLRSIALTPAEIADLCRKHHDLGLGVAGGFESLVPIDIDVEEPKIVRAILDALPPILVAKKGQKGLTTFYQDPYGSIKEGLKFRRPRRDGSGFDMLVEVLVTGQSVLPPTIHPDTRQPYRWITRRTLFNEAVDELPIITIANIDAMAEALKPWLPRLRLVKFAPKRHAPERLAAGSRMEAYARAALAGEVQALSHLLCGRNWALYCSAAKLGKFVHHRILPESEVEQALMSATHRNGYATAKHGGIKKARASLRSGIEKAKGDLLPDLNAQKSTRNRKTAK